MRWRSAFLVSLLVCLGATEVGLACDCIGLAALSPKVATESDLIFAGQAVEVVERNEHVSRTRSGDAETEVRLLEKWVAFAVSSAWRGVDRETVLVAVDNSDCAFVFEPGHLYLVFAERVERGKPRTSACFRTVRLDAAGSILQVLGPARFEPKGVTRPRKPPRRPR